MAENNENAQDYVVVAEEDPNDILVGERAQKPQNVGVSAGPWLTAHEAAAYLKVRTRTLLVWARQGKLKGHTLSGVSRHVWRFRLEDLDAALTASQAPAVVESAMSSAGSADGRQK